MRDSWWLVVLLSLVPTVPKEAQARPILCPPPAEALVLTPGPVMLVDGGAVTRGGDGRFSNDAGFVFDVESATLTALEGPSAGGCAGASTAATLSAIDPFSGAAVTITVQREAP